MTGATVLLTEMAPDPDWEDDFNHWYDTHHIPARMEVPGFHGAQRYKDPERPKYMALYELESEDVLACEAYGKVRAQPNAQTKWMLDRVSDYSRYIGNEVSSQRRKGLKADPIDSNIIYPVFFSVPDERAEEFNSWYTEENVPMLLKCNDWLMVRRFEISEGEPQPWTHLALHYLADISALDSPERKAARNTEWRARLTTESWFRAGYLIFERFGDRFASEPE